MLVGDIDLVNISIQDQVVDIFTNPLGVEKLRGFRTMMGVHVMELSLRGSVEMLLALMMWPCDHYSHWHGW